MSKYSVPTWVVLIFAIQHCFAQLPVKKYFKVTNNYVLIESSVFDFKSSPQDSLLYYNSKAKAALKNIEAYKLTEIASTYQYLIKVNTELNLQDSTLVYLYKSLELPDIENSVAAMGLHWNIFKIYEYNENYNGMLDELSALQLLETKFKSDIFNVEKLRAGILYRAGYYSDAKKAYRTNLLKDSLKLDPVKFAVILNDLACIYAKIGIQDSVGYFRDKAFITLESNKKSSFGPSYKKYIHDYFLLQDALFKEEYSPENFALAENFVLNAIENHADEVHTAVFAQQFLAYGYFYNKDFGNAAIAISKSIELGQSKVHLIKLEELYLLKYRILEAASEKEHAKQTLVDLNLKRDAVAKNNRDFDLIKYDVRQIENSKNRAEKLAQVNKSKYEYSLFILIFIGIVLIIVIIAIYIIYRKNKRISSAKLEISKRLNEKEFLLKELNHRVKNNLALIISLVQFQADDSESEETRIKMHHLEHRITAISLAHEQFLYKQESLTENEYDLKSYILKITNGLTSASIRDVSFDFLIKEKFKVNIDTALPIGMMLNELISNSIEHAITTEILEIKVTITKEKHQINVGYKDNGDKFERSDKHSSLGITIIESMVEQLDGTISRDRSNYAITIKPKKTSITNA
jgi:two-component sensor histidine kinase